VILRTTDGGMTWRQQDVNSGSGLRAVFFIDANKGWAVGNGGTVLHTTTGGEPPAPVPPPTISSQEK
jgi:photosystem II stability/assembly factor-like uncharacterized protein